jgi:cytochrome c6
MSYRRSASLAFVAFSVLMSGVACAELDGGGLFAQNCSACHQKNGKGIPGAFPALAGDAFVVGPPEQVVLTVLNGRGAMPTFAKDLSDQQIAAIITYVRSSWGNKADPVDAGLIRTIRGSELVAPATAGQQAH